MANLEDSQKPQKAEVVVVLVHPGRRLREVVGEDGQEVDDGVERHRVPETGHASRLFLLLCVIHTISYDSCKRQKQNGIGRNTNKKQRKTMRDEGWVAGRIGRNTNKDK